MRPTTGVPFNPHSNNNELARAPQQFNRGTDGFNRGVQPQRRPYSSLVTPARPFNDRATSQPGYGYRPQTFGNSAYGSNYPNHPQNYPNRAPTYANRPQTSAFNNPGYGYGYANRSAQTYSERPNYSYSSPHSSYRAPQFSASRSYGGRSSNPYGNMTARNERSGGFHLFGGGGSPKSFSAPKYSAPKSFGGFNHGKVSGSPKMSHSGGGGGGHRHR